MSSQPALRFLLLADEADNRQQTWTRLSLLGYDVTTCTGAAECISRAAEEPFELILMDIATGEAHAVAELRSQEASLRMPILVVAAGASSEPLSGGDHVLQRPYHLHELARAIGEVLALRGTSPG